MQNAAFHLGRWVSPPPGQPPDARYDPADLTTHAVIVGMTGSGKTGLLIALLEEAARQGLPAVIIDPKGDLTNLLLHFPQLRPADFAPWIDEEAARRQNTTPAALAESAAARWREGLAEWGLGEAELAELAQAVDYRIFTPGSTAAAPVSLLSSFAAPPLAWDEHREALRERIATTVTALLGLIGLNDADPLRSREHILLANLLEHAWSRGQSLDLTGLIEQVQAPPIERLGAFPLERFFPAKERTALALQLNNFLAAPSFQTWLEGQPLDAAQLFYAPGGKPRFSIFYLAHLSETERMFFVTLLLAAVESWMRAQRGSSGLRALLAFDEIVGYLPPVANPPSRPVLLRLLKQARAFGLGLVLSTQNPVDLNYKALSNAGTWFIGRLQTEQDKQRLLDGLQALEGGVDRAAFDALMAGIKPRVFLLHNVHQGGPRLFRSRWALNYLAGPLTRAQLPALRRLETPDPAAAANTGPRGDTPTAAAADLSARASTPTAAAANASDRASTPTAAAANAFDRASTPTAAAANASDRASSPTAAAANSFDRANYATASDANAYDRAGETPATGPLAAAPAPGKAQPAALARPPAPGGAHVYTLPAELSLQKALAALGGAYIGPLEPLGVIYRPALLAQAEARYLVRKYNIQTTRTLACLLAQPGPPAWDACRRAPFALDQVRAQPVAGARYAPLPAEWSSARALAALQRDFLDHVYRAGAVNMRANEALKVYAGPDLPESEFRRQLHEAALAGLQAEVNKITAGVDARLEGLKKRIERAEELAARRDEDYALRRAELRGAAVERFTAIFTRRKPNPAAAQAKRRLAKDAQAALNEARRALAALESEWDALLNERQAAVQRAVGEWEARTAQVIEIPLTPFRKDIFVQLFGVAWLPYYQIQARDQLVEAPAFL